MYKDVIEKINNAQSAGFRIMLMGSPVLKEKAVPVDSELLESHELDTFIEGMINTLNASTGVGLAAPQVNSSIRVILLRVDKGSADSLLDCTEMPLTVMINPTWDYNDDSIMKKMYEGCLSIPGINGLVERPSSITVSYDDQYGIRQTVSLRGFNARVFLHEYDHLEGTVYIDKLLDTTVYDKEGFRNIVRKKREEKDNEWLEEYGYKPV